MIFSSVESDGGLRFLIQSKVVLYQSEITLMHGTVRDTSCSASPTQIVVPFHALPLYL